MLSEGPGGAGGGHFGARSAHPSVGKAPSRTKAEHYVTFCCKSENLLCILVHENRCYGRSFIKAQRLNPDLGKAGDALKS